MSKTLILGAGASFGHGAKTNSRPPLINGFFTNVLFNELISNYNPLIDYIKEYFDIIINDSIEMNCEELYSKIEPIGELNFKSEQLLNNSYFESFAIFSPLDYLKGYVVDLVFSTTSWLIEEDCPFHKKIVTNWLKENDTVISFNYDLIIDFVLSRNSPWKINTGYGWENFYNPSNGSFETRVSTPFIKLLKPHGSLNFIKKNETIKLNKKVFRTNNLLQKYSYETRDNSIEYEEKKIVSIRQLNDFYKEYEVGIIPSMSKSFLEHKDEHLHFFANLLKLGFRTYAFLPFIIMPTKYIPYSEMKFVELNFVWRNLFDSLNKAKEIITCGFSFLDIHFNQTFKAAVGNRQSPAEVLIIEPNKLKYLEIKKRLENHNAKIDHFHGTLYEFTEVN